MGPRETNTPEQVREATSTIRRTTAVSVAGVMNSNLIGSARPLLSVVVPARDSAPWLGEALESILNQDIPDLEVLVVDNGSTDGTGHVVEGFVSRDHRVRRIGSEARSAGSARNDGVKAASGEFLVFADADDIVPDGAYRAMLDSLMTSESDMVIGDHLKFSVERTWSPTRRWYRFDSQRSGLRPEEAPELLSGRPCWNRMFRRSFWNGAALRFPEVQSVEDIEPMTRAFVEARSIDVVPNCVYLYRDRGDTTSLSVRADAPATVRYLEQERACADLVRKQPALRAQHGEIVLDADGWSHLHRFLSMNPSDDDVAAVGQAAATLLSEIPIDGLARVAPIRRALWHFVLGGEWSAARSFVLRTSGESETDRLAAWLDAVTSTQRSDAASASALAVDGLVPAFVNGAEGITGAWFVDRVTAIADVELPPTGSALPDAMIAALRAADPTAVPMISAFRRVLPLVVDHVEASARGLVVGGSADLFGLEALATVQLTGPSGASSTPLQEDAGGWRAELTDEGLTPGRYSVSVSFDGVTGSFPVVTARMPLPPVDGDFPMQPLADRKDGWRFLVDLRTPRRRGVAGLLRAVRRRVR